MYNLDVNGSTKSRHIALTIVQARCVTILVNCIDILSIYDTFIILQSSFLCLLTSETFLKIVELLFSLFRIAYTCIVLTIHKTSIMVAL